MQNRQVPADGSDIEVGHLGSEKAYAFIDSIRVAFDVGALGLGANGDISRTNSLITTITVEGFCSALSLAVAIHESINVCCQQCCRRDGRTVESTNHPVTEYSIYLTFRMASIVSSVTGMALMTADIAMGTNTLKTTIGLMAVSIGIFASRALSGLRHKPAGTLLHADVNDIELGLIEPRDPPPPPLPVMQPRQAQVVGGDNVPLVVDAQPVGGELPAAAAPAQLNQFFQPAQAPHGPVPQLERLPRKKARRVVYHKKG